MREDRELLAELARLNTAMAPLAMRIMDGSASATKQQDYARRLITTGEWLQRRADGMGRMIVEGEVLMTLMTSSGYRSLCAGHDDDGG
jgi:hypothetical protein